MGVQNMVSTTTIQGIRLVCIDETTYFCRKYEIRQQGIGDTFNINHQLVFNLDTYSMWFVFAVVFFLSFIIGVKTGSSS